MEIRSIRLLDIEALSFFPSFWARFKACELKSGAKPLRFGAEMMTEE
jgi:hypothetical protein